MQTLDDKCVEALKTQATSFTAGLVGNPTPNPGSNLTQGSIGHVCYDVGNLMTDNFPKECNQFFNGSAKVYGSAMTSHNESWLYDGCSLTDVREDSNATFHYAAGQVLFVPLMGKRVFAEHRALMLSNRWLKPFEPSAYQTRY